MRSLSVVQLYPLSRIHCVISYHKDNSEFNVGWVKGHTLDNGKMEGNGGWEYTKKYGFTNEYNDINEGSTLYISVVSVPDENGVYTVSIPKRLDNIYIKLNIYTLDRGINGDGCDVSGYQHNFTATTMEEIKDGMKREIKRQKDMNIGALSWRSKDGIHHVGYRGDNSIACTKLSKEYISFSKWLFDTIYHVNLVDDNNTNNNNVNIPIIHYKYIHDSNSSFGIDGHCCVSKSISYFSNIDNVYTIFEWIISNPQLCNHVSFNNIMDIDGSHKITSITMHNPTPIRNDDGKYITSNHNIDGIKSILNIISIYDKFVLRGIRNRLDSCNSYPDIKNLLINYKVIPTDHHSNIMINGKSSKRLVEFKFNMSRDTILIIPSNPIQSIYMKANDNSIYQRYIDNDINYYMCYQYPNHESSLYKLYIGKLNRTGKEDLNILNYSMSFYLPTPQFLYQSNINNILSNLPINNSTVITISTPYNGDINQSLVWYKNELYIQFNNYTKEEMHLIFILTGKDDKVVIVTTPHCEISIRLSRCLNVTTLLLPLISSKQKDYILMLKDIVNTVIKAHNQGYYYGNISLHSIFIYYFDDKGGIIQLPALQKVTTNTPIQQQQQKDIESLVIIFLSMINGYDVEKDIIKMNNNNGDSSNISLHDGIIKQFNKLPSDRRLKKLRLFDCVNEFIQLLSLKRKPIDMVPREYYWNQFDINFNPTIHNISYMEDRLGFVTIKPTTDEKHWMVIFWKSNSIHSYLIVRDILCEGIYLWKKDYIPIRDIGSGAQGLVTKYYDQLNKRLVVFKLFKGDNNNKDTIEYQQLQQSGTQTIANNDSYRHERSVYDQLIGLEGYQHPNIIGYRGEHRDEKGIKYIVLDYAENGSLYDLIKNHPEQLTTERQEQIIKGIANGMNHSHTNRNIIHRDLKLQNILIDHNFNSLITDYGAAKYNNSIDVDGVIESTTIRGTHGYIAPEVLTSPTSSYPSDVFSFGIVMLLILLKKPTYHHTPFSCYFDVLNLLQEYRDHIKSSKSNENKYYPLIYKCLLFDHTQRPQFSEIVKLLYKHETFDPVVPHDEYRILWNKICGPCIWDNMEQYIGSVVVSKQNNYLFHIFKSIHGNEQFWDSNNNNFHFAKEIDTFGLGNEIRKNLFLIQNYLVDNYQSITNQNNNINCQCSRMILGKMKIQPLWRYLIEQILLLQCN